MHSILIGYFPKQVDTRPEWLKAVVVEEICSVSTCCASEGPPCWTEKWLHNAFWLFDDEDTARRIIPPEDSHKYKLFAYKLVTLVFEDGVESPFDIPCLTIEPMSTNYVRLGYDVVSREWGNGFDHSPLCCNHAAEVFKVNRYCLLNDLEEARTIARLFSDQAQGYEPGPYYIVEVYWLHCNG